jgi:glutamate 5-kinase
MTQQGKRSVIKIGSSLLIDPAGEPRSAWIKTLVADVAARRAAGDQIILVSSGAIALGARALGLAKGGRASLEDAQAAAATGQIRLAGLWSDLLYARGLSAAQILVTLDDLEDRRRYLNAAATLDRLLELGVVPVINENDSVATAEIRFGDNDRLAARVAQAARADQVILLSDVDGLYTADPTKNPAAERIAEVRMLTDAHRAMASSGSASGMGSGGMASKLAAAQIAMAAGTDLIIVSGQHDHPLARLAGGDCGTRFIASDGTSGAKAWLAGRLTVRGSVQLDAGAVAALHKGASLLPAGVTHVTGDFGRGDVIDVAGPDGAIIARGLAEYEATETAQILGKKRDDVAAILGYAPRSALIHRDHMVLL